MTETKLARIAERLDGLESDMKAIATRLLTVPERGQTTFETIRNDLGLVASGVAIIARIIVAEVERTEPPSSASGAPQP